MQNDINILINFGLLYKKSPINGVLYNIYMANLNKEDIEYIKSYLMTCRSCKKIKLILRGLNPYWECEVHKIGGQIYVNGEDIPSFIEKLHNIIYDAILYNQNRVGENRIIEWFM